MRVFLIVSHLDPSSLIAWKAVAFPSGAPDGAAQGSGTYQKTFNAN